MNNYKVIRWAGVAGLIGGILLLLEIPLWIIRVILVLSLTGFSNLMKTLCLTTIIVVTLSLCPNELQAQTMETKPPRAGSEYNVLDAWSGIWNVQGEARDSISAPYYHVDWKEA